MVRRTVSRRAEHTTVSADINHWGISFLMGIFLPLHMIMDCGCRHSMKKQNWQLWAKGAGISNNCRWATPDMLAGLLSPWEFSLSAQYLFQGEIGSETYIIASQVEECNYGLRSLPGWQVFFFFSFLSPCQEKVTYSTFIFVSFTGLSPLCSFYSYPHTFVILPWKLLLFARHCGRWRTWKDEWAIISASVKFTVYMK